LLSRQCFLYAPLPPWLNRVRSRQGLAGLLLVDTPAAAKCLQAFSQSLEHLSHTKGRDVAIGLRYAHVNFDRLPSPAAELVDQKVDIIVTLTTQAVAARKATSAIPIVAISVTDPVTRGLVERLART